MRIIISALDVVSCLGNPVFSDQFEHAVFPCFSPSLTAKVKVTLSALVGAMEAPIITYVCVLYKWQVLTQSLASISEKCAEVTLQELKLFFSISLCLLILAKPLVSKNDEGLG